MIRNQGTKTLLAIAGSLAAFAACGSEPPPEPIGKVSSASVSTDSGFEAADGNLIPQSPINFDWNSFGPTTWVGTAPHRTSSKSVSGWSFTGIEDDQNANSDDGFAGGTKQDNDCASIIGSKAPNKDDLERVYVASRIRDVMTQTGSEPHVFLTLGWVRIPQNTTTASAHVAFEFNKGTTQCAAGSKLVRRTAGDMLIVYDFAGGTAMPIITLRRWVTSGSCEISSNSPPCWGPATNLTELGFAEARVNTSAVGSVLDSIGPNGNDTLGLVEFGEAGIDLTAAGVFEPDVCDAFGNALAVSRSSGNSGSAQMKDFVGPGKVNITNCGGIIIRKATSPSPDPTSSTFNFTAAGGLSPSTFSLKDGQSRDFGTSVAAGTYTITELNPGTNFDLSDIDCSESNLSNGSKVTPDVTNRKVTIELEPLDTIDCTFTNTLKKGAIKIKKTATNGDALAGAKFTIRNASDNSLVAQVTTDASGEACVDDLEFGDYDVIETDAPEGYSIDDPFARNATVNNVATCEEGTAVVLEFTDTPLSKIVCSFESLAEGNPTSATIICTGDSMPQPLPEGTPKVLDDLPPGTYTCTVVVTENP